jgi:hypothetical protein
MRAQICFGRQGGHDLELGKDSEAIRDRGSAADSSSPNGWTLSWPRFVKSWIWAVSGDVSCFVASKWIGGCDEIRKAKSSKPHILSICSIALDSY